MIINQVIHYEKKAFVLWSGGLDSTYLIYHLLSAGYQVRAGSVEIVGHHAPNDEQLAIEKLVDQFKPYNFKYTGKLFSMTTYTVNTNVQLQQAHLWMNSLLTIPFEQDEELAIGYWLLGT